MRIMAKRERVCEDESKDVMRLIPDEVLMSILSLLSFKEATTTTTVARRWRHLHRWTRKLDLDGTKPLWNLISLHREIPYKEYKQKQIDLRCRYIRWVESVVANHKSSTLEELRLVYNLDGEFHTDLIDSWLRFAVSRKVEKLELSLTPHDGPHYKIYSFPYKNGSELTFIKKLCTNYVGVSGEVVSSFLRNCPLLEHLSVSESLDLSSLEIIDTFPSFKQLDIFLCYKLDSVVIRDSHIEILKMYLKRGPLPPQIHQFVVSNVPLLTQLWTQDISLHLFSVVLPQIEMLKLYATYQCSYLDIYVVRSLAVEMSNLKEIVVVDDTWNDKYSHIINFIKGSHVLQRFVLEAPVNHDGSGLSKEDIPIPLIINPMKGIDAMMQYPCLKEIKLAMNGYASGQFEMVMHLVESGVALQNIVVDTHVLKRSMLGFGCNWDSIRQTKSDNKILEMARALQSILPPTITLTIL